VWHAGRLDESGRRNVEACIEFVERDVATLAVLPERQRAILDILRGRVLTLKALAGELGCDPSRLHRDHLKPLLRADYIRNDRRVSGYYRPDEPPGAGE